MDGVSLGKSSHFLMSKFILGKLGVVTHTHRLLTGINETVFIKGLFKLATLCKDAL